MPSDVDVHAYYKHQRVAGLYHRLDRTLTVTSQPLPDTHFRSPGLAAAAVVAAINPEVSYAPQGWTFWTINASGAKLVTLRHL